MQSSYAAFRHRMREVILQKMTVDARVAKSRGAKRFTQKSSVIGMSIQSKELHFRKLRPGYSTF